LLQLLSQRIRSSSESALIMVELKVIREKCSVRLEIALIVGVKERSIESGKGSEQFIPSGLRFQMSWSKTEGNQQQDFSHG
jgi:hypothetical protein